MKKCIRLLLMVIFLALILSACSSSENQEYTRTYDPIVCTNDIDANNLNGINLDDITSNHTEEPTLEYQPNGNIYLEDKLTSPPSLLNRAWIYPPSLTRLTPYIGGSYTDGQNTYLFKDDGIVLINAQFGSNYTIFALDNMQNLPSDLSGFYDTEELLKATEIVAYHMDDRGWDGNVQIIHVDGDTFFLHFNRTGGGGSGESFFHREDAFFFKVNISDRSFKDFGEIGAVHIIWYDGYFYYMDLIGYIGGTPGTGKIMRMDMDGANKKVIVDEITMGPFSIGNGRVFFSNLADGIAYSVDLDGNDKTPVNERIVPRYHRAWLEFYGSSILNRAWQDIGYSFGIFVMPSTWSHPAIMCLEGCCLAVFPNELRGDDPFRIINWGYYDYQTWWHGSPFFMVLQSNVDGSFWVYSRGCRNAFYASFFEYPREQLRYN